MSVESRIAVEISTCREATMTETLDQILSTDEQRDRAINSLLIDYVGEDPVSDLLLDYQISAELLGKTAEPLSEDTEKLEPEPEGLATEVQATELRPGSSARVGQTGYRLMILEWTYNGSSGGHSHSTGSYNCNLPRSQRFGDGEYTTVTIGAACGTIVEKTTVYTHDGQSGSATGEIHVKIPGLVQLGTSPDYYLIGSTTNHPSNHWVTSDARTKLRSIASEYRTETGSRLYYNDSSLISGGLFDVDENWSTPHDEHRDGTRIDIAATSTTLTHEAEFVKILRKHTTNYIIEGSGGSRHYHVRF